ncbi:hypothetical protein [Methanobrevibacter sp. DSM 116169]|uniref:hypothetical protein n=1 Tax=Methanobrevibacter sp. DSM 116169 TaxID=3242727 RepID=UPI0038FD0818
MFKEDKALLDDLCELNSYTYNTMKTYRTAIKHYTLYHRKSMSNLIKEALKEQGNNTPEHKLKIYDRLIDFRTNYILTSTKGQTATTIEGRIKSIYKQHRVKIPYIPPLNNKQLQKYPPIAFENLLKKEEILQGLELANKELKSEIMTWISSGSAINETKSLTIKQFYEGTYPYHQTENIQDSLEILNKLDNVIGTLKLYRAKTGKYYYSFINPETVTSIVNNLLDKNIKDINQPLFKYSNNYTNVLCKQINDTCKFGKAGAYSRFVPHMFRKYNSTYLNQGKELNENVLTKEEVDMFHGRGINATHESYFKNNPNILKFNYVKVMNNVSLYNQYSYEVVDNDIIVKRIDTDKQNKKLSKKVKDYENILDKLNDDERGLENYADMIGHDNFMKIFNKID